MTDFFIIAEGSVDRHVQALAAMIMNELTPYKEKPAHVEGMSDGDWVVLDYYDVIIHLFTPEMREKYDLARLWDKGKIVDVEIDKEKPVLKKTLPAKIVTEE